MVCGIKTKPPRRTTIAKQPQIKLLMEHIFTEVRSVVAAQGSTSLPEVFTVENNCRTPQGRWAKSFLCPLTCTFGRLIQEKCGSQPAGVIWSLLGFWLLRSQTLVTHLHSGGEMPDTVVVFVSESENNHLRTIALASFIYRHHPVWPAVCLVASWLADRLTGCLICRLSGALLTL